MMNRYMGESINRVPLGVLLCLVMTWICWRHIPADEVLMWASVVLTGNFIRTLAESNYARKLRDAPCDVQAEFMRRITPIYLVLAAGWGSSPLLFYDRMSEVGEFACWSILAGMMYVPLPRLALVPRLSRLFTSVFFGTAVFCIIFTAWRSGPEKHALLWFIPLALLQWSLTRRMTSDTHRTQRDHYGMVFDLAAQKQEALEAVQTKNRFLAAATHDMRQPVIALSLYAEYLEADPDSYRELAPKITRATTAVNNLFSSLFDLSKFDAGEVHLAVEEARISELIESLATIAGVHAKAKGIDLRVRVTGDPLLQTDTMRLRRMIGHVVSNAIKYSHPGTKILLTARARGGKVRVEVWDQGIGIPASKIKNVFDEFYRAEAAAELAPDGMGIGLSLVTRLAAVLNTRLTIASVEGRGTRVTMDIEDVDTDPEKRRLDLALG
ncbi:sensor histidine kinase [Variovorax ginsengisoli]|uniref:histidine kinase n=1 Tax=Variovorax ginsengisoli TaxID=363844 RepID=A0ABT8SBX2_9BURK|nr:HAMP domain-containing sensor histidine kinase [Variovorax ginsengisoli]MDN8617241.1 HAMP domain-containing sensor histidine kinase [Variovorax ginsengisoli]MDO1536411.1 HAMP domain-containing sensor histidine kinase [Variovorax ginsengisoli]